MSIKSTINKTKTKVVAAQPYAGLRDELTRVKAAQRADLKTLTLQSWTDALKNKNRSQPMIANQASQANYPNDPSGNRSGASQSLLDGSDLQSKGAPQRVILPQVQTYAYGESLPGNLNNKSSKDASEV